MALRRSSYAKFVSAENREEIVRSMMQEQHKEMMKDLVSDRIRNVAHLFPGVEFAPKSEKVEVPINAIPAAPPATPKKAEPAVEKTLDELIIDFLNSEKEGKP